MLSFNGYIIGNMEIYFPLWHFLGGGKKLHVPGKSKLNNFVISHDGVKFA